MQALRALKTSGVYDDITRRHARAMQTATLLPGETGTGRNVAHRGPAFCPWHRQALRELELHLQSVDTGSPPLAIPYWRWEAERTTWQTARIWTLVGGNGDSTQGWRVTTGPFADWISVIWNVSGTDFVQRAGILRQFTPWTIDDPSAAQLVSAYDVSPWSEFSNASLSFRQALESPHNSVHVQIGGDMNAGGTAPNDPVFWLHHANVDRQWARWQQARGITNYQPTSGGPPGHNLNDVMQYEESATATPASVLDWVAMGYTYDVLG
ncbi:MAG: tyrosinase family protein [Actinomycetota bacterium]|nr:tyrosinase family protein [Actinomycetota bacterium]